MEITDVQVKLIGGGDERLKASCTIVFDAEFVVRDVKIIQGTNGLFVAMPSRKVTAHCPSCSSRNHLRALYCNQCGHRLPEHRIQDEAGVQALHAETAHPINSECREKVHRGVITAYEQARQDAQESATARIEQREDDAPHASSRQDPGGHGHQVADSARHEAPAGNDFGAGL